MQRAIVTTFSVTGAIVGLTLVTSILLARNLGPDGRGLLLALTFWPPFWSALLNLSLNEAVAYHVARSDVGSDKEGRNRLEASSAALQAIVAVATTLCTLALIATTLPTDLRPHLSTALWFAAVFAPVTIVDLHFKAVLQGRGSITQLNVVRLVQPVLYAGGVVGLAIAGRLDVEGTLVVMAAALTVSAALSAMYAGVPHRVPSRFLVKQLLSSGWRYHTLNVVLYAAAEFDKLVVLYVLSQEQVGFYAVAIGVSALGAGLIVQSLAILLGRRLPMLESRRDQGEIIVIAVQCSALLLGVVNGFAAAFAGWWVPLLFGDAFAPAVPTVQILLGLGVVKGLRQVLDRGLRAAHVTRVSLAAEATALVTGLPLAIAGGLWLGAEGVAVGMFAANTLSLAVMLALGLRALSVPAARLSPFNGDTIAAFLKI